MRVIKVPGGAVLRGCKKTQRKYLAHLKHRAEGHSQLRVIASLFVLRIILTCLHLAAASSAGTSLVANLKHITVTLATWDAVCEVYLDPKWAQQRLRLYGAQDRALEQFFKQRIGESRWRPLELCYWPEQGKLPAKGKEYPKLGYKQMRDKPPKAQQQ
ncbi:hypothetical protein HaLaN_13409 [Haematococcus lacustris]|uniref:Uncharacterized protein n=1 Tax=Haematococcus lacustris TaxID=44745 RepID=A0A699ZM69_HAELA|nr:hypothetical protein HaLaN_13409 [Haematococcus lacustris]